MKYILTSDRLTVVDDNNVTHSIQISHPRFDAICKAVSNKDQEGFEAALSGELTQTKEVNLADFNHPLFVQKADGFFFRGKWRMGRALVTKLESMIRYGLDIDPLIKFLDNLFNNTSYTVVNQLLKFMEYDELPITEDGCFIAYKGISSSGYSIHGNPTVVPVMGHSDASGRIYNGVGEIVEIDRNLANDDPNVACDAGLHAGSFQYAKGYSLNGILATVKINPVDVVSVPRDSSCQKLRCCKYEVIKHDVQRINQPVSDGIEGAEVQKSLEDKVVDFLKEVGDTDHVSMGYCSFANLIDVSHFQLEKWFKDHQGELISGGGGHFEIDAGDYKVSLVQVQ